MRSRKMCRVRKTECIQVLEFSRAWAAKPGAVAVSMYSWSHVVYPITSLPYTLPLPLVACLPLLAPVPVCTPRNRWGNCLGVLLAFQSRLETALQLSQRTPGSDRRAGTSSCY